MGYIKSPCTNICQLNVDKICLGCFRTIDEIANWTKLSEEEKYNIIMSLSKRKDEIF